MTRIDSRVEIISEQYPDAFAKRINEFLAEGNWRVAETEVSVSDHHYWAMLIKSVPEPAEGGEK